MKSKSKTKYQVLKFATLVSHLWFEVFGRAVSLPSLCLTWCWNTHSLQYLRLQVLRSPRAEHSVDSTSVRPFEEKLGRRFMITCRSLKLMLQGCINESETDPVTNVSGQKTQSSRPWTPHRAQTVPPDRAVLRVAVPAGRARRQEGVGRLPRGPEPRGGSSDAGRLL